MRAVSILIERAKRIHQTEGFQSLARRGLAFVAKRFFDYESYYLTVRTLDNAPPINEADLVPPVDDLSLKIIETNEEADELEGDGYRFRSHPHFIDGRRALDSDAIAFCLFVGRELAAISWAALTPRAMNALNEPPIKLDFARGESFVGSVWTNPKYRRMGFRTYRSFKARQFLRERGIVAIIGYTTEKDFAAATQIATEASRTIYARGRYLRVLWWKSWKERQLAEDSPCIS